MRYLARAVFDLGPDALIAFGILAVGVPLGVAHLAWGRIKARKARSA